MIPATTIDPSRRLDFPFRLRRAGSKKFIFLNSDGTALDISSFGFVLNIKEYPGARTNTIQLTIGSGLTVGGAGNNELTASLTVANTSVQEQEYYWELYKGSTSKTYLNGLAPAHNGVFDGVSNDQDTLTVTDGSSEVTIVINDASGESVAFEDITGDPTDNAALAAALAATSGRRAILTLHADNSASISLPNQGNSEQTLGANTRSYVRFDASIYSEVRIHARIMTGSNSVNSPRIYPWYSLTLDGSGARVNIGATTGSDAVSLTNAVNVCSSWMTLPEAAKADVIFGAHQNGGDGASDPLIGNCYLEFRAV